LLKLSDNECLKTKNVNYKEELEPFMIRVGSAILSQICNMLQIKSEQVSICLYFNFF